MLTGATALITWRSGLGTFAALVGGNQWVGTKPSEYPTVASLLAALSAQDYTPDVEDLAPQPPEHHDVTITVDRNSKIVVAIDQNNRETVTEVTPNTTKAFAKVLIAIAGLDTQPDALARLIPPKKDAVWCTTAAAVESALRHNERLPTTTATLTEESF